MGIVVARQAARKHLAKMSSPARRVFKEIVQRAVTLVDETQCGADDCLVCTILIECNLLDA